ncbi:hypothetical protein [Candidatus Pristimantibacillus sp. PTI5]|uniref:hypothetical protein n=1 Tax=Candidatus Pristimantibacillus sp. PTI5 TaxID=3400422 RepID=UPI003B017161
MLVTILDHSFTYHNEISSIEPCLVQIEEILNANDVSLVLMEINGVEVYEGFQAFLIEHIQEIEHVHIKVQTEKQMMETLVITMKQYLEDALPEVKKLGDEFYQGASKTSWDKLTQLLEGTAWIVQSVQKIQTEEQFQNCEAYIETSRSLHAELSNLEEALKNEDLVLTGDILKYEIVSIFEQLLQTVTHTIDNEVKSHDLS